MKDLKAILQEEKEVLKALLQALENQRDFVMENDSFALDKVVDDIKKESVNLAKIEKERREFLMGVSVKEYVNKTEDKLLKEHLDEVSKLVDSIALRKEGNELLIKQSLIYTNKMLAFLNPQKAANTYTGYGKLKR